MDELEFVGWFGDLPHGIPGGPTLRASVGATPAAVRRAVADYLERGAVVAETLTVLVDVLAPGEPRIGPYRTLTDGHYVWPSDYAHYVATYGAAVPAQLQEQAARDPQYTVTRERLDAVIDELIGT